MNGERHSPLRSDASRRRGSGLTSRRAALASSEMLTEAKAPLIDLLGVAADVVAQPRHGPELHDVGCLVKRDPAQKRLALRAEAALGLGEVGGDEEKPRRSRGPDQRDVVLAQNPLGHEGADEPQLDSGGGAGRGAQAGAERAGKVQRRSEAVLHAARHRAQRGHVRPDPLAPVDHLRRRQPSLSAPSPCSREPRRRSPAPRGAGRSGAPNASRSRSRRRSARSARRDPSRSPRSASGALIRAPAAAPRAASSGARAGTSPRPDSAPPAPAPPRPARGRRK